MRLVADAVTYFDLNGDLSPDEIVDAFTEVDEASFPTRALITALANPEAVAPRLLQELAVSPAEVADRNPESMDGFGSDLRFQFSAFVLAAMRDSRAFRPLGDFFSTGDGKLADYAVGDLSTMELHVLFAATFTGDPAGLYDLILKTGHDPAIRGAAIKATTMLAEAGRLPKYEVTAVLMSALEREPRTPATSQFWPHFAFSALNHRYPELRQPFLDLIDQGVLDPEEFSRKDVADVYEKGKRLNYNETDLSVLDDLCGHLESKWGFYLPYWTDPRTPDTLGRFQATMNEIAAGVKLKRLIGNPYRETPFFREGQKTGRNDPCHCGSGKKYKRCCLDDDQLDF